jgi:hypothetical protein
MGTSRSSSPWLATALLYSGRRDPEWPIPESLALQALEIWHRLPRADPAAAQAAAVAPSRLGYRGVTLISPDGRRWTISSGLVTHAAITPATPASPGTQSPAVEARLDPANALEHLLLNSAPQGTLPQRPTDRQT